MERNYRDGSDRAEWIRKACTITARRAPWLEVFVYGVVVAARKSRQQLELGPDGVL